MKKLTKRSLITNIIIFSILIVFFSITVVPSAIVPIYKGIDNQPIYNGNTEKKQISLMFNVYENTEVVNNIVNLLNEYNVKSTFFVGGCWADDNITTLNHILSSGHELGNHGYFHKEHENLSYDDNFNEIFNTHKVVSVLTGYEMNLFAPPSGSFSKKTLEASYNLDYKVIMWSKDTIDWRDSDKDLIFSRATKNIKNGDLILMHPKPHTLLALRSILEYYINNGYKIVTVSENIL